MGSRMILQALKRFRICEISYHGMQYITINSYCQVEFSMNRLSDYVGHTYHRHTHTYGLVPRSG